VDAIEDQPGNNFGDVMLMSEPDKLSPRSSSARQGMSRGTTRDLHDGCRGSPGARASPGQQVMVRFRIANGCCIDAMASASEHFLWKYFCAQRAAGVIWLLPGSGHFLRGPAHPCSERLLACTSSRTTR